LLVSFKPVVRYPPQVFKEASPEVACRTECEQCGDLPGYPNFVAGYDSCTLGRFVQERSAVFAVPREISNRKWVELLPTPTTDLLERALVNMTGPYLCNRPDQRFIDSPWTIL
jgi:hypothetical protein